MSSGAPTPHLHTHVLFRSPLATVRDVACRAPRSPIGGEERAGQHMAIFPRAGVFVRHAAARGRGVDRSTPLVASAAHALLFNADEPYRVSHPTDDGDHSTVLAVAPDLAREIALAHDRRAWHDAASPFGDAHVLVPPALRLRLGALRAGLRAGALPPLAAETMVLEILGDLIAARVDAAGRRAGGDRPPQRAATRRARRDLAEAVKEALARDPAATIPLAALAREVATSPYHLARVFHAEVGLPVHQYQLRLRLALAVERLGDPHLGLSALALDLGFASHGHFTRAFRRLYGLTPSVARARMRLQLAQLE